MNYRKYYTEKTKKPIPKNFDIHHIDFNRDNNSIENLVAIPKQLHTNYHNSYNEICKMKDFSICEIKPNYKSGLFAYYAVIVESHYENNFLVSQWILFRDILLGIINGKCDYKY